MCDFFAPKVCAANSTPCQVDEFHRRGDVEKRERSLSDSRVLNFRRFVRAPPCRGVGSQVHLECYSHPPSRLGDIIELGAIRPTFLVRSPEAPLAPRCTMLNLSSSLSYILYNEINYVLHTRGRLFPVIQFGKQSSFTDYKLIYFEKRLFPSFVTRNSI